MTAKFGIYSRLGRTLRHAWHDKLHAQLSSSNIGRMTPGNKSKLWSDFPTVSGFAIFQRFLRNSTNRRWIISYLEGGGRPTEVIAEFEWSELKNLLLGKLRRVSARLTAVDLSALTFAIPVIWSEEANWMLHITCFQLEVNIASVFVIIFSSLILISHARCKENCMKFKGKGLSFVNV